MFYMGMLLADDNTSICCCAYYTQSSCQLPAHSLSRSIISLKAYGLAANIMDTTRHVAR